MRENVQITTSQENPFNYSKDTFSTSSQHSGLEGGRNQEWKHIIEKIGHTQEHNNPQPIGETLGGLVYELKKPLIATTQSLSTQQSTNRSQNHSTQ